MRVAAFFSIAICFVNYAWGQTVESPKDDASLSALITGLEPGWKSLEFDDFVNINCKKDTWRSDKEKIVCNGNCNGGFRTKNQYRNFELILE